MRAAAGTLSPIFQGKLWECVDLASAQSAEDVVSNVAESGAGQTGSEEVEVATASVAVLESTTHHHAESADGTHDASDPSASSSPAVVAIAPAVVPEAPAAAAAAGESDMQTVSLEDESVPELGGSDHASGRVSGDSVHASGESVDEFKECE